MKKSHAFFGIIGALLIFTISACFKNPTDPFGSGSTSTPGATPTPGVSQVWVLTDSAGDQAKVLVPPFTYSGTFSETSDSPHWWLYDGMGNPVAKFVFSGETIVHDTPYDRWSFQTTASGGGMQVLCSNSGTANGNYPNATTISNGTSTGTATSPMGTQQVNGTWTAVRQ